MKRIVALAVVLILSACTNSSFSGDHAEPEREYRYHRDLNENGYLYDASELVKLTERNNYPVWVYYGTPQKHGDGYLLRVSNESDAASMVLEVTPMAEVELIYGLDPLVGWKTGVVGRYTSSDNADPSVPGASGTLVAVDIGWLRDPDRPQGPYANLRGNAAERLEKPKLGD